MTEKLADDSTAKANDDTDIEASGAPLLDHLVELRTRLIRAFLGIAVGFGVCFYFADQIFNILLVPYERAAGSDVSVKLIYTAPQEFFFTQLKLGLFGAFFLAFPLIAIQVYKFAAPGLYKNERRSFWPFLVATPFLFIAGASLLYFVVMPLAMQFFLGLEQPGGDGQAEIRLLARVSEYLSLIMTLLLAFGICFQMPVLFSLLARAGIVSSEGLRKKRKYAVVGVFAMAAVLTPPDPITQIGLALPTLLLYEISILCVRMIEKKRKKREAETES